MNWTIVLQLGVILLYVQILVIIVSLIFIFAFVFCILLPETGGLMAWITLGPDDRKERAKELKEKYCNHPLRVWQDAIYPFAWWWLDAIEFVSKFAKRDRG